MGEVYLAYDSRLRRQVAIKLLPEEFTENKARLSRFEREAYAASSLNHPNILTIYEIGQHDGHHFIATEYVDGESLRHRIVLGSLELRETLGIAIQIADALAAAHEAGIVHRDIKPENVMVRRDGYVKILDFGLAKLVTETSTDEVDHEAPTVTRAVKTEPGVVMGTANYMSPEQARGFEVDSRTDIWSLGTVLYEMVAGRMPFEGATKTDVMATILHREPPSLLRFRSDVPLELERIVEKTLTKERDERYQLARDLSVDLKRLKQRVELDAKLERDITPPAESKQTTKSTDTSTGTAPTAGTDAAPTVSSAEYVAREIKRHKPGVLLVAALVVVAVGVAAYYYKYSGNRAQGVTSIAVLPFVNASGDANADYLSDGLSESLIDKLSQLPGLKVIAHSSVFKYKGKEIDPQEVASALGVDAIVTGRVVQRGEQLQVRAELINTHDKTQLWGDQYNRQMTDQQAVQEEIARAIAEKLRVRLTGAEEQQLSKRATTNPEAYQLYQNGVYYHRKTLVNLPKALDYYNQAVTLDPKFALAWAKAAETQRQLAMNGAVDPKEGLPRAKAAAEKALQLDDSLAEAHVALAGIMMAEWDWTRAEPEYTRALELNPNLSEAYLRYSALLSVLGRQEEALSMARTAQDLDPLDLRPRSREGGTLYFGRRYDEAIQKFESVLKLAPDDDASLVFQAYSYSAAGRYKEAIANYEKLIRGGDKSSSTQCYLGYALGQMGKRNEAQAILQKLMTTKEYVSPAEFAVLQVGLGDKEGAIASLEKAYAAHDLQLQFLKVDPDYDSLRNDPRFIDLMRRVGLPQ